MAILIFPDEFMNGEPSGPVSFPLIALDNGVLNQIVCG